ncbi:hypothetical protein U3516DRAFT_119304 [Neocallimastix sp. 'constans']
METKKKKNRRVTQACNFCKIKRVKCSGDCPCQKCVSNNVKCIYSDSKKRGRKIKIDENKYLSKFSDACILLYNSIPEHIPIMNNGDPKYDIFINYELINSFYQYSTFEIIPFLNSTIIRNRIQNREIYYSLLFGLYALSEIFRPYGDYNLGLKYKEISRKFIKLILDNKQTGSIQLIETLYILSLIETGNIYDYIYSKWALITLWNYNIYEIDVPEYRTLNRNNDKYNHISLVYSALIVKHIFAQITSNFIEYFELYDPEFENKMKELYHGIDFNETDTENFLNTIKIKPRLIMIDNMTSSESFFNLYKINKYTNKVDLNDLLQLKYKGNNVLSLSAIKLSETTLSLNQSNMWLMIEYHHICQLRNTLFLFSNVQNKKLIFDASMFIEEDRKFFHFKENIPYGYKLFDNSYFKDSIMMFLCKYKFYSNFQANRIFLYRAILRLILNSMTSQDLISNIKASINNIQNQDNENERKISIYERNQHIYLRYINNNYYDRYYTTDSTSITTTTTTSINNNNHTINNFIILIMIHLIVVTIIMEKKSIMKTQI